MTSYAEWFRERRRVAKAREEQSNPALARRRARSGRKYARRKEAATMQDAFVQFLMQRVRRFRPDGHATPSVGQLLARELTHALQQQDEQR